MGTTVATTRCSNARGTGALLVTLLGFRDALRLAYQPPPCDVNRVPELRYSAVVEPGTVVRRGVLQA